MLCRAHTDFTGVSPSASRRIPMTCSSLYLLFFIVLLPFLRSRTLLMSRPAFGGQVTTNLDPNVELVKWIPRDHSFPFQITKKGLQARNPASNSIRLVVFECFNKRAN